MPSPGVAALKTTLAVPVTIENGKVTQFSETGIFIGHLAEAIDAGWTCASPTTPSTFQEAFAAKFTDISGGAVYLTCLSTGLDAEVDAWVSSWDSQAMAHTFIVTAASIYSRVMTCSPVNSAGTRALAQAVADVFVGGFGQETG